MEIGRTASVAIKVVFCVKATSAIVSFVANFIGNNLFYIKKFIRRVVFEITSKN